MKHNILRVTILLLAVLPLFYIEAQTEDEEQILFYQMEPFDDSLFIKIQDEQSAAFLQQSVLLF